MDLHVYKEYLVRQVEKSNVRVLLNTEATRELIESLKTEVLFIAVGATPVLPPVPGIKSSHVIQALDLFPVMDKVTEHSVAVIGGGTIGCEIAIDLAEKGKENTEYPTRL